jgi:hypothetical protein
MKRSSQIKLLLTILAVGFAVQTATADEPSDKPQPKLIQAKQPQIQAIKQQRTFSGLLQKGQTVTLYQFSQEALYQVRIVNGDQKKQIEVVVERNRKELEGHQNKLLALQQEMRNATDGTKRAEFREEHGELRRGYQPAPLPVDIRSANFYTISDVGGDYVGFERNGVETFHRLSSIHRIIRGVEIDEQ